MAAFSYKTISAPAEGIYKEKGSKFLGFAVPVSSEEEVKAQLAIVKKKYFDAKHHCFAYVLGPPENKSRSFDAGEPNHSAGDPILGRIRSADLVNVLVVVVRYFGGVKLGVGGLVQAYRAAAGEAISKASIVEREVLEEWLLTYNYSASPEAMRLVKDFDLRVVDQNYSENGVLRIQVRTRDKERFMEKIKLLQALHVAVHVQPGF